MIRFIGKTLAYLGSRIQFKIILPFAILTVMVAIIGTYLSARLVSNSLSERFTRQLFDTASGVADGLAQREQFHLSELRSMAFTEGVAEAVAAGDRDKLEQILFGIIVNDNVDRVDIVGLDGRQLITIRRPPNTNTRGDYTITSGRDMRDWPTVDKILNGVVDGQGDKQVALTTVEGGDQLLITAGPIKQGDEIVGAILVSTHVKNMLRNQTQATFSDVSFYDLSGNLVDTSLPVNDQLRTEMTIDPLEVRRLLDREDASTLRTELTIRDREYALLHDIFWARGEPQGFFSVALQTQFIETSQSNVRNWMAVTFLAALLFVFGIGFVTSNIITNRVKYLMENAMAVASGDFSRRTQIGSRDEIGLLARSLDNMTDSLSRYTTDLQNKIDELTALYESSTAVTVRSGLNLDHVLRAVTTSIKEVMRHVDHVVIHLLDDDGQILTPIISTPSDNDFYPPLLINREGQIHDILSSGQPQTISFADMEKYSLQGGFHMNGHKNALLVPLVAGREAIGMLTLTLQPGAISEVEPRLDTNSRRLLGTFANQAAIAIKNAQLFEATEKAYQDLQQLDDLKTEFINIAAHALRTPLGAIMGHASFVEKRAPEKLRKYMSFIVTSALRMRTMVDAMLTIQRLDAGTAFLKLMTIDIRDTIKKVAADYRPMAELEGHTFEVSLPDEPLFIEVDPEKIGLVFSNLISNAIKFTPEHGRITISAQDYSDSILVKVTDTGIGIPPQAQKQIFERFYQVPIDQRTERGTIGIGAGHGGIGIGLTIVKHLLELHQGDIWVESEPDKGTTFFVTIPKFEENRESLQPIAVGNTNN